MCDICRCLAGLRCTLIITTIGGKFGLYDGLGVFTIDTQTSPYSFQF